MPRKRRRRREVTAPEPSGWQWRTFPVFLAFAVGILVGAYGLYWVGAPILWVGLFGVVFGLTHMVTRGILQRRQQVQGQELPGRGVPTGKRPS